MFSDAISIALEWHSGAFSFLKSFSQYLLVTEKLIPSRGIGLAVIKMIWNEPSEFRTRSRVLRSAVASRRRQASVGIGIPSDHVIMQRTEFTAFQSQVSLAILKGRVCIAMISICIITGRKFFK